MANKRRGQPRIEKDSETICRSFRIPISHYRAFCLWCESKGLKPTKVIREIVEYYYIEEILQELGILEIKEIKK